MVPRCCCGVAVAVALVDASGASSMRPAGHINWGGAGCGGLGVVVAVTQYYLYLYLHLPPPLVKLNLI